MGSREESPPLICRIENIRIDWDTMGFPISDPLPSSHFPTPISTTRFRLRLPCVHGPPPPFVVVYLLVKSHELLFFRCLLDNLFIYLHIYLVSYCFFVMMWTLIITRLYAIGAPITFFVSCPACLSRFVIFVGHLCLHIDKISPTHRCAVVSNLITLP